MIKAPYNPIDVANYIVAEAIKRKSQLLNLKLQNCCIMWWRSMLKHIIQSLSTKIS